MDHPRLAPWLFPALLSAVCLLLQSLDLELALRYDRTLIGQGAWWRLLSANFIHLGWSHLALNLAGALLVFALFPAIGALSWLALVLASSVAVGLAVYFLEPQLYWYVGLSGTLHAMFAFGALGELRRAPRFALLLLAALLAKLTWEQLAGALPGTAEAVGGEVVVDAHLYGALAGAALAALWWRAGKRQDAGAARAGD